MVLNVQDGKLCFDEQLLVHIRDKHNDEVRSALVDREACKARDSKGATLLHFAAEYDNAEITKFLIDSGAEVNAQDELGRTALLLAVTREVDVSNETIQVLLDAKADFLEADIHGKYPLQHVLDERIFQNKYVILVILKRLKEHCQNDDKLMADLLMKAGCSLELAICSHNPVVTELMIKAGCQVDAPHPVSGHTALHTATGLMDVANVKMLIKYGANITARANRQIVPLRLYFLMAMRRYPCTRNREIMKLLLSQYFLAAIRAEDTLFALRSVFALGDEEDIQYALQFDIDFSLKDEKSCTVWHYLAENPNPNVVNAFAGKKFDVHVRTSSGATPLHRAVMSANPSTVRFLLDRGADVDAKTHKGITPLLALFLLGPSRHATDDSIVNERKIVKILLRHGAEVQVVLPEVQMTIFDVVVKLSRFDLGEPILAKLVLSEKLGEPVIDLIRSKIESNQQLKKQYSLCQRQLEEMKRVAVYESITMFELLRQNEKEIIRRHAYNQELFDEFERFDVDYLPSSYYFDVIQARIANALPKIKLIQSATEIIFHRVGPQLRENYLVVRKIVDYLDCEDMKILNKV